MYIWTVPFTAHTDASDKKLVAVISNSKKRLRSYQKIEQANIVTSLLLRRKFS